jgi:hydroxypyruvate isomerase
VLRFDANVTMLYRERPLGERFAAARSDGFTAVEILILEGESVDGLASAARQAGVDVVLCNAPMGDFLEGGPGLSAVPGREADFRRAIEQARKTAVALRCPTVHIGPSRVPPGLTRDACLAVLRDNLAFAAGMLAADDIVATIEPMNTIDVPDVCLDGFADAVVVMDAANQPNTALQLDLYHAARMRVDLPSIIERHMNRIGHIQFADVPGRHEPGSGELPFAELFGLIDSLGYSGYLGAEYRPLHTTPESLGWFDAFRADE